MELYAKTIELLKTYQVKPKKGLSQNFLIDVQILNQIEKAVKIGKENSVLEIGAGLGFLTRILAEKAKQVAALEIDKDLYWILSQELKDCKNLTLLQKDILKFKMEDYVQGAKWIAAGNLPYHVSGGVLRWALDHQEHFKEFYFMLQKEVAERIAVKPGSKIYGVLSLLCQYFTAPEILFTVPKDSFLPKPQVDSAFVKMTVRPSKVTSNPFFVPLVKHSFAQRRKTIYNNLKSWGILKPEQWVKIFRDLNLHEKARAEEISLEIYIEMADLLCKNFPKKKP
ncbi:MAG: 16S rRNA (adenine(1518)-N(6)/adenine(1519)-N(6))-dimethyltransferase RsmA [Firmicutes bacterium]|nr:16S rRNA (adenine(1518)-N(6)/adenine(1519)-N(6))-dimethyltransferase RsmA [Bacillota bacterium]